MATTARGGKDEPNLRHVSSNDIDLLREERLMAEVHDATRFVDRIDRLGEAEFGNRVKELARALDREGREQPPIKEAFPGVDVSEGQ